MQRFQRQNFYKHLKISFNELKKSRTSYDKDWYFNTKNVSSYKLVINTFEFIEKLCGSNELDFINVFYEQYKIMDNYLGKPLSFINHLNNLELINNTGFFAAEKPQIRKAFDKENIYLIKILIIKWLGGLPIQNSDTNIECLITLLYKEVQAELESSYIIDKENYKEVTNFLNNKNGSNEIEQVKTNVNDNEVLKSIEIEKTNIKNLKQIEPILWNGTNKKDIAYIFWQLEKLKLLECNHLAETLSKVFMYNNEVMSYEYFTTMFSKFNTGKESSTNAIELDKILLQPKKQIKKL